MQILAKAPADSMSLFTDISLIDKDVPCNSNPCVIFRNTTADFSYSYTPS